MPSTPRRDADDSTASSSSGPVYTPSAPQGLVISKFGIQASADENRAQGLMCVKITLPREGDGRHQRWGLFSGSTPKLRSIPALYPLPITPALASTQSHLPAAMALLQLAPGGAQLPERSDALRPYVDVSARSGQVFVAVDESPGGRRASFGRGGKERSEWLIVIEFTVDVQTMEDSGENYFKAVLPTPKCLDNVVRLGIEPRDATSEVSILSDPRCLPLPSSMFAPVPGVSKRRFEDGWEDGEIHGVDSEAGSDEGDALCLEGRFTSTDRLTISWGWMPSIGAPPDLRITPNWDDARPSIDISFEATIPAQANLINVEAVLPPGWGWAELQQRAEGLFSWRSTDGLGMGALVSATASAPDDSMDTISPFSPTPSAQPLDLASLDDDYSFELNSFQDKPVEPTTPNLRRSMAVARSGTAALKLVPRVPTASHHFELEFEPSEYEEDRALVIEGKLAPLPHSLIPPDAPVPLPFFRFNDASMPNICAVVCPSSKLEMAEGHGEQANLCDVAQPSIGSFTWSDEHGDPLAARAPASVTGPVRVAVQRNIWGVQTVSMLFSWPMQGEVALAYPTGEVRVVRASSHGTPLSHAVTRREAGTEVRVAGGRGQTEVVLEVLDETGVAVPQVHGGGELRVALVGDGWSKLSKPVTNLQRTGEGQYVGELGSPARIALSDSSDTPPKRSWVRSLLGSMVSPSKVYHLLLIWAIASIIYRMEYLQREVRFAVDETRDLRLYGYERAIPTNVAREWATAPQRDWENVVARPADPTAAQTNQALVEKSHQEPGAQEQERDAGTLHAPPAVATNVGLGRVVLEHQWAWLQHPSVQAVARTVTWLWQSVLWLLG